MKLQVEPDRCCGSGNCVMIAPELFGQTEDEGVVVLLDAEPPPSLHESAAEAADVCPVAAIVVSP